MIVEPVVLTGRHVRLEPVTLDHVPGLFKVGSDPEIWRYMPYGQIDSLEKMRALIQEMQRRQANGTDMPFVAIHLESNSPAGCTRYMDIQPAHRGLEIGGTWYGLAYRRTVVNTECKYLLLKHAFETLGCIRVQLKTDLRNERSQRAIERIGAAREGVLRKSMIMPDGHQRYSVYYSIVDDEWPGVKKNLEGMLKRDA